MLFKHAHCLNLTSVAVAQLEFKRDAFVNLATLTETNRTCSEAAAARRKPGSCHALRL